MQQRPTSDDMTSTLLGVVPSLLQTDSKGLVKNSALFVQICKSHSLELSTPITLRVADGDSSSSLTHRTVPLQLHIGKHVETAAFYENPPNISKTFDSPLVPDTTSNPVELSPIDCSLSNFISLGSMQTDVHPFVKVSPISDVSIPPDILPNFSLLFSEDRNPILTIDLENS
ncbi:hypothetical protein BASA83_004598 [Batrachochytrium salamandrivorans]|nr:hypothetical protein BASA83_004598 [Batrachochytrium salamandrivorans]